jgi:L-2-hydroxyglutarate oxidase LhgO
MEQVDITIVGAGVIGLAVAAQLSRGYKNIVLIERNDTFGQEISSRNSEVIHAGIYYPKNSFKAKMCVEGKELLYEYCIKIISLIEGMGNLLSLLIVRKRRNWRGSLGMAKIMGFWI